MDDLLRKLTIAIPVYNDEKYIRAAVGSCLGQAARIVIYDNASTDGTGAICAELAARHETVTHVRHPENVGAFENFRRSLSEAETEYFSWVGSHDLLGPGYSLRVLGAMEEDPGIALGAGTVVHIDEDGRETGQVTRSHWADLAPDASPLIRAGTCLTRLRKDCSIFYGIYRTALLRDVWFDTPCLGFDRVILGRISARGRIRYVEDATFFARNLDKTRDARTDRDRRAHVVGHHAEKPLPKNVFTRNKMMVQTILDQAHTPEELTLALDYIQKINRKYQNRRYYQRRRLALGGGAFLIAAAFGLALYF